MFATRNNNENAVYEQQTAQQAKSVGVKGLAPKTPANKAPKTPFRLPLNDENAAKTVGKGLFGDGKGGKAEKSAFVTPAGPRTRAPLGAKTTNVKATAFQTPAPPTQEKHSAKLTSPRLRRGKVKVHEPAPAEAEVSEDDVPDVEYMPPREVPLPDYPSDCDHDWTYPQFQGKNLTRGWWSEFASKGKTDEDDSDVSDLEEQIRAIEELERKEKEALAKKAKPVINKKAPPTFKPLATIKARSAASALSSKPNSTPSFAAPTAAAKARLPPSLTTKQTAATSTAPGNTRHTAAKAASNTTLGYSKGRTVSAVKRTPLSSIPQKPNGVVKKENVPPKGPNAGGMSLDELLGLGSLNVDDDGANNDLLGAHPSTLFEENEESAEFQLDMPEF